MKKLIILLLALFIATPAFASFVTSDTTDENNNVRTVKEVEAYFQNGTKVVFIETTKIYVNGDEDAIVKSKKRKEYSGDCLDACLTGCNYDEDAIEAFVSNIDFDSTS